MTHLHPFVAALSTLSVTSGVLALHLLRVHARIERRADWYWVSMGTAAATAVAALQLIRPADAAGGLEATALTLICHLAVPASALFASGAAPLRRCRPFLATLSVVALTVAASQWMSGPARGAVGSTSGALELGAVVVSILSFAAAVAWYRRAGRRRSSPDAWFVASLVLAGIGLALLASPIGDRSWLSLGFRLAQPVALAAGLTIHISRTHLGLRGGTDLAALASSDSSVGAAADHLTGALSRRGLELALERSPSFHDGAVVLVGLGGLEEVDGRAGHVTADRLLGDVAAALAAAIRADDLLARWDDDEFVVVLRDCPPEFAAIVADRIRVTVGTVFPASVGTSHYELGSGRAVMEAIRAADEAMRDDRAEGRAGSLHLASA